MKQNQTDDRIRHEAALAYAQGEVRAAISILIDRINSVNGHCDAKVWLCVLDIYQAQQQQAPYEKLAVFFSNRFHFSPPAWESDESVKPNNAGQWRNALIVEGSIGSIPEDKLKDFLRASKENGQSRLDLSRMRLSEDEQERETELETLLGVMMRLRRHRCQVMLMGESHLITLLTSMVEQHKQGSNGTASLGARQGFLAPELHSVPLGRAGWAVLLEIYQWRGMEQEFDQLALTFARDFDYCPVGYDPSLAIAVAPTTELTPQIDEVQGFDPGEVVLDAAPLLEYAQDRLDTSDRAEFSLTRVKRMGATVAQDIAGFLQAMGDPEETKPKVVFRGASEIVATLLEATGVSAFATVQYRHEKLRNLLEK